MWKSPERNFDRVQFEDLRKQIDPIFNALADELSDCYYNFWKQGLSKPFIVGGKSFDASIVLDSGLRVQLARIQVDLENALSDFQQVASRFNIVTSEYQQIESQIRDTELRIEEADGEDVQQVRQELARAKERLPAAKEKLTIAEAEKVAAEGQVTRLREQLESFISTHQLGQNKQLFDKLHGLIWHHYQIKFHKENLKRKASDRYDEAKYNDVFDDKKVKVDTKDNISTKEIQKHKSEGIELTI